MLWRLLYEFICGIFNLEFDVILILQTRFSADILEIGFRYSTKIWLGIGYWLWCYDLFVEKWHWKAGFHLLECSSGFERSSVPWLICVIHLFHCGRKMFSPCLYMKTEYLHSNKVGILLPFVKLFQIPSENYFLRISKGVFWGVITTVSPAYSLSAFNEFLVWETESSLLAFVCAIFFLPCGASLNPCWLVSLVA